MRSLLESKLNGSYLIQHLPEWTETTIRSVSWNEIDVVLAELNFQDRHVFEVIPEIRKQKVNMPVVLVTNKADKDIFIRAINSGVNGFVEKPVEFTVLRDLIERHRCCGFELRMNDDRKAIYSQGKWVDLTSTEYKIIETLRTAKRRLTRGELQASVWPNSSISENNLDTHLTNLKRKIPELTTCLNVKRGLGYYLDTKNSL
ncbi:MAG: response regulator transcription factor [Bdellovibrionales bacterium]|nr:response regulator transcription factor [Bdellovibrionales bacterium]